MDIKSNYSNDMTSLIMYCDPSLPTGWRRKVVPRKKGGRYDVYITSPSGKRFRSRTQLQEYLATNTHMSLNIDQFSFSLTWDKRGPKHGLTKLMKNSALFADKSNTPTKRLGTNTPESKVFVTKPIVLTSTPLSTSLPVSPPLSTPIVLTPTHLGMAIPVSPQVPTPIVLTPTPIVLTPTPLGIRLPVSTQLPTHTVLTPTELIITYLPPQTNLVIQVIDNLAAAKDKEEKQGKVLKEDVNSDDKNINNNTNTKSLVNCAGVQTFVPAATENITVDKIADTNLCDNNRRELTELEELDLYYDFDYDHSKKHVEQRDIRSLFDDDSEDY